MKVVGLFLCLFVVLAVAQDEKVLRLIRFNESFAEWLSPQQIEGLMANKVHFMDVTEVGDVDSIKAIEISPLPNQPSHKIYIDNLLPTLSSSNIASTITTLGNYYTRYYTSTTGQQSALWIQSQFTAIANANQRTDITVQTFQHTWLQPSVIAIIPGIGPDKSEIVVIGAHEDSVGRTATGQSPGADDDASGTATVLETFRALVAADYYPDRTLIFMTYAAEEAGLLGSQAIAASYYNKEAAIYGVLQLDMTAYSDGPIGIITDYTDANLTAFVRILVDSYTLLEWENTRCGYACSDHASWNKYGYRASFPFETGFSDSNPYIHSANDLLQYLDLNQAREFAKLALAFAVELAGTVIAR